MKHVRIAPFSDMCPPRPASSVETRTYSNLIVPASTGSACSPRFRSFYLYFTRFAGLRHRNGFTLFQFCQVTAPGARNRNFPEIASSGPWLTLFSLPPPASTFHAVLTVLHASLPTAV